MNARCDSFDMINYVAGKCKYCWLIGESGVFIGNGIYYNTYYSEGEN